MPAVWAVLLLLGLGALGVRGCLQCDEAAREVLGKLRDALVPKRFAQEALQARARILLLGMEGPFFRDYALNAFVGKVEVDHLQVVASFVKNQSSSLQHSTLKDEPLLEELEAFRERVVKKLKKYLRSYELKACDPKICEFLREEVVNCLHCQKSRPKCIKTKYCFVLQTYPWYLFQEMQAWNPALATEPLTAEDQANKNTYDSERVQDPLG
ncbi:izumo sperm-egg fusion protein 2 [Sorex fumeus]|uniref:izumo sperm-egg fusion protein 2 n=1 Tax=Sorex fumeus TaxID=62283 RepID=UPI0024ADABDF|nr:izumo sperm-egg fusion protein 2 [Sorex fumeus]